ncbi:MAG: apolipoprotein N-acyltransferase [Phycisphaerae bacterium]|nr:apolipoprotein N-acyltransferase [Phycisphaerae bacterium]
MTKEKTGPMIINLQKDFRNRRIIVKSRTAIILMFVSALLMSLIYEPIGWSFLAWFGLVPWVIANVGTEKPKHAFFMNLGIWFLYYLANLSWLWNVTGPGLVGLAVYLGFYIVFSGWVVRGAYLKRRWPMVLVLPVAWVAQEYLRAVVLTGFPWLFISHSQHNCLKLIQCCDIFGAYGVTFIVAMVNGFLCDLLLRPLVAAPKSGQRKLKLTTKTSFVIVSAVVVVALFYGAFRIKQSQDTTTQGPLITVVQESIPQYVEESGQSSQDIFDKHYDISRQALSKDDKPMLVVWPETVINSDFNILPTLSQEVIDDSISENIETFRQSSGYTDLTEKEKQQQEQVIKDYFSCPKKFDNDLRSMARDNEVYMLIGAAANDYDLKGEQLNYNSAFLYQPDGSKSDRRYDKMHLVPFGEVVPFKKSCPWLNRLLNSFTPYDYDYSLDYGQKAIVFEMSRDQEAYKFGVMICYEDVTSEVARELTVSNDGKKRADFLLNITNAGWYVSTDADQEQRAAGDYGKITTSAQHSQHLAQCRLRAVENRVGIARSVNTGISCFIKPDGSLQAGGKVTSLAEDPFDRQGQIGFVTDNVYIDSRISLYSKIGDVFAIACVVATALILIVNFKRKSFQEKIDL